MTIETKYNVGDEVWFLKDNKATTMRIWDIDIRVRTAYDGEKTYGSYTRIFYYDFGCYNEIEENKLFPTKEELLKSL